MKKLKSLLLCVFAALRDKNIQGVHHNAPSTLPLKPQAKKWVLTLRLDLRSLARRDNEKAGPVQIRLPPPVAFGDKLYVTRFMT
jgi:hypothetical protein